MLAGAHRILRIVTHHQRAAELAGTIGTLPSMRQRQSWARSVHRLLEAVSRGAPAWWQYPHPYWDFPPLTRRQVIWACRPALLAIAGVLGDERQPVSAAATQEISHRPERVTIVRRRPPAARRAAQQLQCSFTGHPEPY
jgi:hypothetical protein